MEEATKDPKVKANFDKAGKRNAAMKKEPSTTAEVPTEPEDAKTFPIRWHHNDPPVAELASSYSVLKISDSGMMNCWIRILDPTSISATISVTSQWLIFQPETITSCLDQEHGRAILQWLIQPLRNWRDSDPYIISWKVGRYFGPG